MSNKTTFFGFDKQGLRKYGSNTGWLLLEKAIRFLTGILIAPLTANYLGAEQYGKLEYAIGFVFLLTPLAALGVHQILTQKFVKDEQNQHIYFGSVFWLRVIAVLIVLFFLNTIAFIVPENIASLLPIALPEDATEKWLVLILSLNLFFNISDLFTTYFQSQVRSEAIVKVQIIVVLISAALKILGIWKDYSVLYFANVLLIETILTAIGLALTYTKAGKKFSSWKFELQTAKAIFRESLPLILSGIAVTIYTRIDQIMVKQFLGDAASGHYGAAVRLSEMWYFLPVMLSASLFPAIIKFRSDEKKYYKRMQQFVDLSIWLSVIIALPITFLSKWIIVDILSYGEAFAASAPILSVHVWAGVFVAAGIAGGKWLLVENKQKFLFYQTALGAITNFVLNWMWIPEHGIMGAAWATVISYFIGYAGLLIFVPSLYPLLKIYLKTFLFPFFVLKKVVQLLLNKLN